MLQTILHRLARMVRRDVSVIREIRFDTRANLEAACIVALASLITALGAAFGSGSFLGTLSIRLAAGILLNWLFWSYATVFILTNFYGVDAEFWQTARLIGYANIPMVLSIFGVFGCLGSLIAGLSWVIVLVMAFFLIREAFELATERAIVAIAVGWLAVLVVSIPLSLLFRVH